MNAKRVDRRLLALALVALGSAAACGPQVVTPTPPNGMVMDGGALGAIPRPGLATDLGTFGPGVDGSGDFLSFASELSPALTMAAYADQLVGAGFQDVGRQGAWRVFNDPSLTLWVRVGSGGPPTSLIVRVTPRADEVAAGPVPPPVPLTEAGSDGLELSAGAAIPDPKASSRPGITTQRPDPPHALPLSGGVGSAGGASSRGTPGASAAPGSGGSGPATGTGTGVSTGGDTRP